jgi:hypothetical protein
MRTETTLAVRIGIVNAMARRAADAGLTARTEAVTDLAFTLLAMGGDAAPVVETLTVLAGELETAMVRRGFNRREIPGIIRRDCADAGLPLADATVNVKIRGMSL